TTSGRSITMLPPRSVLSPMKRSHRISERGLGLSPLPISSTRPLAGGLSFCFITNKLLAGRLGGARVLFGCPSENLLFCGLLPRQQAAEVMKVEGFALYTSPM